MIIGEDPEENWRAVVELNSVKEQQNILKEHLQAREPITRFSQINKGDHLVRKKSRCGKVMYYHHFLCVGFDSEGRPIINHYFNTLRNAAIQFFGKGSFNSGSALGEIASIQELTLPHKDFIESESALQNKGAEVERVIWPEKWKRYSTEEVIERAERRKNESCYSLADNNCESFVMWCLCDLNISLQATLPVLFLTVGGSATITIIIQVLSQIPKYVLESVEKLSWGESVLGNAISTEEGIEGLSAVGSTLGVVFMLLWEICNAAYNICQAKQKWKDGVHIKSRKDFIKEVSDTVISALFRSAGSISGLFVGQLLIPVPVVGGLVGLLTGASVGRLIGKICSYFLSKRLANALDQFL